MCINTIFFVWFFETIDSQRHLEPEVMKLRLCASFFPVRMKHSGKFKTIPVFRVSPENCKMVVGETVQLSIGYFRLEMCVFCVCVCICAH